MAIDMEKSVGNSIRRRSARDKTGVEAASQIGEVMSQLRAASVQLSDQVSGFGEVEVVFGAVECGVEEGDDGKRKRGDRR